MVIACQIKLTILSQSTVPANHPPQTQMRGLAQIHQVFLKKQRLLLPVQAKPKSVVWLQEIAEFLITSSTTTTTPTTTKTMTTICLNLQATKHRWMIKATTPTTLEEITHYIQVTYTMAYKHRSVMMAS